MFATGVGPCAKLLWALGSSIFCRLQAFSNFRTLKDVRALVFAREGVMATSIVVS
jgi:hypothetical protein